MRITVPPFAAKDKLRLDQLNEIRSHVRKHIPLHGDATEFECVVTWKSGDRESMVFDRMVGTPVGETYPEWLAEWAREAYRV